MVQNQRKIQEPRSPSLNNNYYLETTIFNNSGGEAAAGRRRRPVVVAGKAGKTGPGPRPDEAKAGHNRQAGQAKAVLRAPGFPSAPKEPQGAPMARGPKGPLIFLALFSFVGL